MPAKAAKKNGIDNDALLATLTKLIANNQKTEDEPKPKKTKPNATPKGEGRQSIKSSTMLTDKKIKQLMELQEKEKQLKRQRSIKKKAALQKKREAEKTQEKQLYRGKDLEKFNKSGDLDPEGKSTSAHKAPNLRRRSILMELITQIGVADEKYKGISKNNLRFGEHTANIFAKLDELQINEVMSQTLAVSMASGNRTTMNPKDLGVVKGIKNHSPDILTNLQNTLQSTQQAKEPKEKSTSSAAAAAAATASGGHGMSRRGQKPKKSAHDASSGATTTTTAASAAGDTPTNSQTSMSS